MVAMEINNCHQTTGHCFCSVDELQLEFKYGVCLCGLDLSDLKKKRGLIRIPKITRNSASVREGLAEKI